MSATKLVEPRQRREHPMTAATRMPHFSVKSFGMSHPGRVRESNQDRFAIAELARALHVHQTNLPPAKTILSLHRARVFMVADGVGGSSAGEVASGLLLRAAEAFQGTAWGVSFVQPDLLAGAAGGNGGMLYFWRPDQANSFATVRLPNNARDLALHPDGCRLAVPFFDGVLRIYDMTLAV